MGLQFRLLGSEAKKALDVRLNSRLQLLLAEKQPSFLLAFAPLADEPDIVPVLKAWLAAGRQLALPVWEGGNALRLRKIRDFDQDLVSNGNGIREPAAWFPEVDPASIDLVLTPGRAFALDGMRLGRGAGCYDVLFFRCKLEKIGVAYDFQVAPRLPGDSHDVAVDSILTPSGWFAARKA